MRSGGWCRGPVRFQRLRGGLLAIGFWLIAGQAAFAAVNVSPASLPAGTLGVPYEETLTGSGGTGPYGFAVTSGTLPTGISLNGTTGELSGTPSTQGVYNFTIQATDSLSATGSRAYTTSVGTFSLAVQPNTLPNGTQGNAYNQTLTAVGGNPPYAFTVSSGALPTGLTLDPGGVLSGTPTGSGTSVFIVQAQDPDGNTGYRTYNISIGTNSLTIAPPTLPNGTQGTAYSQTVTASGGTGGPYTYSVSSGALPAGLSLNTSSGAISGTPTSGGSSSFTIRAVDGNNNYGSQNYTIQVGSSSLTLNPGSLPSGLVSTAYNQTVTASGGTGGPYTYSVTSGSLPTGLSLNASNGTITGTPTAGGAFSFNVHAVDGNNNFGDRGYTVNIGTNSLTVTPGTLPNGTQATAYSQTVGATGGTAPYSFAVISGALPTGLSLNTSSGAISGTPSASGAYNFTIRATDANSNIGSQAYTVNIAPVPLTVNPTTLPNGTQGSVYTQTVTTSGGTGPYTYTVTSGALPAGLSINVNSGAITGTPSAAGPYNFTIQSTDSTSNTGSRAYAVSIGTISLALNPATLPNGTQGTAYNQNVTATGGTGPYTYAVSSGALPAGLSLNSGSGAISGTPSGSGASSFTVQATDSNGNIGSRPYNVNIGTSTLTVNPATLPNGTQGTAYNQNVTATGGTGPYTYAVSSGALPAGLSFNSGSGAITGTPSGSGASSFTVQATDSIGNIGSRPYNVSIGTSTLTVNPATLPNGSQGIAYNQTVTATGGTAPYTYALSSGALPAGLSFNSGSGAITGTPSGSGASSFTVRATDSNGNVGSRPYNVSIGTGTLTVNPATLPNGSQGIAYNQTVTAAGGTAPYTYALSSGALPAGLSLNASSGAITGTPTGSGASAFTIKATDANGNTGNRAYNINTGASTLSINPASLPAASQGSTYSQTVTATGGTGPYTLALVSGALPAGLTFNAGSGAIAGTPTGNGPSTFAIRATDANGNTGTRTYNFNTGSNSLTINPASIPAAMFGKAYNQALSVGGGTAPYTYSLQSGALPPGMSLGGGVIAGTPTSEGSFAFVVLVRDANGNFGTRSYSLSTARPDPSADPDVRGLVASQAATARRFTDAQTTNVMRRLEGLHGNMNPCGLNFGVSASVVSAPAPAYAVDPVPINRSPYPPSAQPQPARPPGSPAAGCDPLSDIPIAVWGAGALEVGKATANGLIDSNKFSTSGITAGIDMRVADPLIVGAAVGYGLDHSDIGLKGTISDAQTLNGMAYASYKPTEFLYLDALVGYGALNFDNTRRVAFDNTLVSGARTGNTWFGSLSLSYDIRQGAFKFSPYARLDAMMARLNQYSEAGNVSQALTFQSSSFSSTAGVVGLRGSVDIKDDLVNYTPNARVEYKRAFDRGFTQSMFYNEIGPGGIYTVGQEATTRDVFTGAIGLRARFGGGATLEVEYALSGTPSRDVSWQSQMIRAMAHWNFDAN